jgi:putative component of toxin-antitoxin plasmid stabilization module
MIAEVQFFRTFRVIVGVEQRVILICGGDKSSQVRDIEEAKLLAKGLVDGR